MSRLTVLSKRARPVGEVFTFTDGVRGRQVELKVVRSRTCEGCYFNRLRLGCDVVAYDLLPSTGECVASQRADGHGVVFKEVLKD